ncbi:MAG: DUF2461 domain-containing protein, partial [Bacteroidales bacterium]|nr:DUF2461 domain-containing protein [Bacteroidales bacterium]
EKLKLAPKGFPKDFLDIDLLKYKSYAVLHPVSNEFWIEKNVVDEVMKVYKTQNNFNKFLNRAIENIEE